MNQILKLLTISFYGVVFFSTVSLAQVLPGPPMICGDQADILSKFSGFFNETEFMVLQSDRKNQEPYYILFRNEKSGTWTIIAYNVPSAPPDIACVTQGGLASYILPDINAIKKMLDKQEDGLDEPTKPKTNENQT